VEGNEVIYDTYNAVLLNGGATSETFIDLANYVPKVATVFQISALSMGGTADVTGVFVDTVTIEHTSGKIFTQGLVSLTTGVSASCQFPIGSYTLPNTKNGFYYYHTVNNGSAPVVTFLLLSYKVPNGGP